MTLAIESEPVPLIAHVDGVFRVGKSRVTLDTVVYAFCEGATAEEIVQQYPTLELSDVYTVIGYYLKRQQDVNSYLQVREYEANATREENEIRFDPVGLRDRLLARRTRQG